MLSSVLNGSPSLLTISIAVSCLFVHCSLFVRFLLLVHCFKLFTGTLASTAIGFSRHLGNQLSFVFGGNTWALAALLGTLGDFHGDFGVNCKLAWACLLSSLLEFSLLKS